MEVVTYAPIVTFNPAFQYQSHQLLVDNLLNDQEVLQKVRSRFALFHGSNKEFTQFEDANIGIGEGGDLFGKGFYLTDNIKVADFYAHHIAKKEFITHYTPTGILKTHVAQYEPDADTKASANKKINTFLVTGKILDSENYIIDESFQDHLIKSFQRHNKFEEESARKVFLFLRENKDQIHGFRGEMEYIIKQLGMGSEGFKKDMTDYIKGKGYVGVKYPSDKDFEGEGSYNYVIYKKGAIQPFNSQVISNLYMRYKETGINNELVGFVDELLTSGKLEVLEDSLMKLLTKNFAKVSKLSCTESGIVVRATLRSEDTFLLKANAATDPITYTVHQLGANGKIQEKSLVSSKEAKMANEIANQLARSYSTKSARSEVTVLENNLFNNQAIR